MKFYEVTAAQLTNSNNPFSTLSAMIGARNFGYSESDMSFQFHFKGCRKVNAVRIVLNSRDLYDVEFYKIANGGLEVNKVCGADDLFADDLKDYFEHTTGLYLSL